MIAIWVMTVASLGAGTAAGAQPADVREVLARAGAYVEDYRRRITTVVAEEQYVQRSMAVAPAGRT